MNVDFKLRTDPRYHNPAITQIFDALYMHPDQAKPAMLSGPAGQSTYTGGYAVPQLKSPPRPRQFPQGQRPYVDWNSYQNPGFRAKYNLPKKQKSRYFDPLAYTDLDGFAVKSELAPYNPEMPQSHLLFKD
jgi:hypothetical protein